MSMKTTQRRKDIAIAFQNWQSAQSRYDAWISEGSAVDHPVSRQLFNRAERAKEKYHEIVNANH